MKTRLPAVVVLLLSTTLVRAAESVTCSSGVWSRSTSEKALIEKFGKGNVKRGNVYVGEGVEEPGTILFPNDEKRRVEIVWRDKRNRQRPEWLRLAAGSLYETFHGVRPGMSLVEVEKLNGRPFQLQGFDWDFSGTVTDWRGGRLATPKGAPCRLQVRFERVISDNPSRAEEQAVEATSGDRELSSASPQVRRVKPRVETITLSYE